MEQVEIVLVGQTRIDPADHVDFCNRHIEVLTQTAAHRRHVHLIGSRAALLGIKGAEFAALVTDVRIVDVLIADVVGPVAVQAFADDVGHVADSG